MASSDGATMGADFPSEIRCDICGASLSDRGWIRAVSVRSCWPCWDLLPEAWRTAISYMGAVRNG